MEYKTVVRSSKYENRASRRLDEKVNELLSNGWVLLGDVSISTSIAINSSSYDQKTIYVLAQAMTKTT